MVREIQELFQYNRWANQRSLQAAAELGAEDFHRDLGSSFPSVQATLAHIVGAEWIWLQRWLGRAPAGVPAEWDLGSMEALRAQWSHNDGALQEFVNGLRDRDLHGVISYRTLAGAPYEAPLWQLMRHLVNHSTYHRGQVATLLRQLGAAAPATDLVLFYRDLETPIPLPASGPS